MNEQWDRHPLAPIHVSVVQTPCDLNCDGFWSLKKKLQKWNLDSWSRRQRQSWRSASPSSWGAKTPRKTESDFARKRGRRCFLRGEFGGCYGFVLVEIRQTCRAEEIEDSEHQTTQNLGKTSERSSQFFLHPQGQK